MYPSPLSLGRHIVQMSPEIWVVHGERPTQCLGYKIICWVTYPIPSSKLQCPQKKCSIYKRNRNVHTHMVYIHLFCRALTKRSISQNFQNEFSCIIHISLSLSILCQKILAENHLQSSFLGSIKTLYPIFRV